MSQWNSFSSFSRQSSVSPPAVSLFYLFSFHSTRCTFLNCRSPVSPKQKQLSFCAGWWSDIPYPCSFLFFSLHMVVAIVLYHEYFTLFWCVRVKIKSKIWPQVRQRWFPATSRIQKNNKISSEPLWLYPPPLLLKWSFWISYEHSEERKHIIHFINL